MGAIHERKAEALEAISQLFSNTDADEGEQIEVLEEIREAANDNIEVLREQIRLRCREDC